MFVSEVGKGPVVVLLHGTPSPASDWLPLAEKLAPQYRVLVPDLPGYGQSPALANPSVEQIGDAIATMLRDRGVSALAAIVGFSTGAYRAFDLVLRHRIPVDLMVSLAGVVCFDAASRELRRELARRLAAEPDYIASSEVRGLMCELMLSPRWRTEHPADEARVAAWLDGTTSAALATELESLAASRDLRPELRDLRASVYARVGELDLGCPPAWSEDLVSVAPQSELERVPGCGHALLIEDREGSHAAILRRLGGAR